jgi:hypothetical protein
MNQSRNWVEYDTNKSVCYDITGLPTDYYANVTYYEYQLVGPTYTNTSWGSWINISCLPDNTMNQSRNLTQYDIYYCAASTIFIEYKNDLFCNYSTPFTIKKVVFRNYQSIDVNNLFCYIFYQGGNEFCFNQTIFFNMINFDYSYHSSGELISIYTLIGMNGILSCNHMDNLISGIGWTCQNCSDTNGTIQSCGTTLINFNANCLCMKD